MLSVVLVALNKVEAGLSTHREGSDPNANSSCNRPCDYFLSVATSAARATTRGGVEPSLCNGCASSGGGWHTSSGATPAPLSRSPLRRWRVAASPVGRRPTHRLPVPARARAAACRALLVGARAPPPPLVPLWGGGCCFCFLPCLCRGPAVRQALARPPLRLCRGPFPVPAPSPAAWGDGRGGAVLGGRYKTAAAAGLATADPRSAASSSSRVLIPYARRTIPPPRPSCGSVTAPPPC